MNEMRMSSARRDIIAGTVIVAVGAIGLAGALRMPTYASRGSVFGAPGLAPGSFSAVLLVLGTLLVLRAWRFLRAAASPPGKENGKTALASQHRREMVRVAIAAILIGLYVLLLRSPIDYRLATGLFMFAFQLVFDSKRTPRALLVAAAVALLTAFAVDLVLIRLFMLPMP